MVNRTTRTAVAGGWSRVTAYPGNNPSPRRGPRPRKPSRPADARNSSQISLPLGRLECILPPMSFRPVRKISGSGNVFLGTRFVDFPEYDLAIYGETRQ